MSSPNFFENLFGNVSDDLDNEYAKLMRFLSGKKEIQDIADQYRLAQTTCPACSRTFKIRFAKSKVHADSTIQVKCPGCSKTLKLRIPK